MSSEAFTAYAEVGAAAKDGLAPGDTYANLHTACMNDAGYGQYASTLLKLLFWIDHLLFLFFLLITSLILLPLLLIITLCCISRINAGSRFPPTLSSDPVSRLSGLGPERSCMKKISQSSHLVFCLS